jgi:hypothetical protein
MVVVEIRPSRVVHAADVHDGAAGVIKLFGGGNATDDRRPGSCGEQAGGQQVVFVGAAGVGQDRVNHGAQQHGRPSSRRDVTRSRGRGPS